MIHHFISLYSLLLYCMCFFCLPTFVKNLLTLIIIIIILSVPIKQPISPNLAEALCNPALREASYSLPDGTIVIDPKKKSPNLAAALQNPYLKSASYTLPDGTIIIDPRKPVSPNLSNALQNSALRDTSFTLPEGIHDPNTPISPNLIKVKNLIILRLFVCVYLFFPSLSSIPCNYQ